jgi:plasmid stabilization system protein ParE
MPRVVWSELAVADLSALNDWLTRERTPQQAIAALRAIRAQTQRLDDFPAIGSPLPSGLRKLPIHGYPFAMLYDLTDRQLLVVRLVHNRSDWTALA